MLVILGDDGNIARIPVTTISKLAPVPDCNKKK